MLIIILLVLLLSGGFWGYSAYPAAGPGIGIVGLLVLVLLIYLLLGHRL